MSTAPTSAHPDAPRVRMVAKRTWHTDQPYEIADGLLKVGYEWAEAHGVGLIRLVKGANSVTIRLAGGFVTASGSDAISLLDLAAQLSADRGEQ